MIDINELRRKLGSDDIIDHIDIHANVRPIITELIGRIEAVEKEYQHVLEVKEIYQRQLNETEDERDALRAEIERLRDCK